MPDVVGIGTFGERVRIVKRDRQASIPVTFKLVLTVKQDVSRAGPQNHLGRSAIRPALVMYVLKEANQVRSALATAIGVRRCF